MLLDGGRWRLAITIFEVEVFGVYAGTSVDNPGVRGTAELVGQVGAALFAGSCGLSIDRCKP